ncbi:MAG: hypothetical protein ACJATT_001285 [Myxococcota bacterium]
MSQTKPCPRSTICWLGFKPDDDWNRLHAVFVTLHCGGGQDDLAFIPSGGVVDVVAIVEGHALDTNGQWMGVVSDGHAMYAAVVVVNALAAGLDLVVERVQVHQWSGGDVVAPASGHVISLQDHATAIRAERLEGAEGVDIVHGVAGVAEPDDVIPVEVCAGQTGVRLLEVRDRVDVRIAQQAGDNVDVVAVFAVCIVVEDNEDIGAQHRPYPFTALTGQAASDVTWKCRGR